MNEQLKDLEETLEGAISSTIRDVLMEFEDEITPNPLNQIRMDHAPKCVGITVQGNTASFCGCLTSTMVEAVMDLHHAWHQDMSVRINRLETKDGMVDKRDVLFLLSENSKWG